MKRLFAWLLIAGVGLAAPAFARTNFSINVGIGFPAPPQHLFYGRPPLVLVPGTPVYYVDESEFPYDCFLVDGYYYLDYDGSWYRAESYRGPWFGIRAEFVPRPIFYVPHRYWHNQREGARWIARRGDFGAPRSGGTRFYERGRVVERGRYERGRVYSRPAERSWNRGDREGRGAWARGGERAQHQGWSRGGRSESGMSGYRGGARDGGRHESRGNGRGRGEGHRPG